MDEKRPLAVSVYDVDDVEELRIYLVRRIQLGCKSILMVAD